MKYLRKYVFIVYCTFFLSSILLPLELTRVEKSSIQGRLGRLLLVVSVAMIPFLLCVGVFSRSQAREPYVYLINKETNGEMELVIMAAVSSTSSTLTSMDSEPIKGLINTRCQLSGDMKGDILMINISIPRCRMLVKDKHFMERIKKSRMAAAVILDDTPRHKWRVSSPYQSLSLYLYNTIMHSTFSKLLSEEFPSDAVFMVRRDDWIQYDHLLNRVGHKVFISLGSIRCETKS